MVLCGGLKPYPQPTASFHAGVLTVTRSGTFLDDAVNPDQVCFDLRHGATSMIGPTMTQSENVRVSRKGRATKFAPENIQKIKDCVAQGLSREEIAKLLDVTVGSLQVTCSRLGISLRRPRVYHPSYDRLKPELQLRMVEKNSRPKGKIAISMQRQGEVGAIDVPLSNKAIGELALLASVRDVGLVELIAQILCQAVKKDLVGKILDDDKI